MHSLTTPPTPLPERNLDVLRAVAVLCVVGSHAAVATGHPADGLGRIGVLLFFVHTALVLMGSLERTHDKPHWIGGFYLRRAFRIYPLAIVTILGVLMVRIPFPTPLLHGRVIPFESPSMVTVLANLGLVQNVAGAPPVLNVLWTLPLELQMYTVLPLCFLLARRSVAGIMVVLGVGTLIAALWVAEAQVIPGLWRLSTLEFVPCFLAGVLCYALLRRRPRATIAARRWPIIVLVHVVAYATLYAVIGPHAWPEWVVCTSLSLAIWRVGEMAPSMLTGFAATVARYSYGIYLVHVPALWLAVTLFRGKPDALVWVMAIVLLAGLSWLAFHAIERPGIALGKRLVGFAPARPLLPVVPAAE